MQTYDSFSMVARTVFSDSPILSQNKGIDIGLGDGGIAGERKAIKRYLYNNLQGGDEKLCYLIILPSTKANQLTVLETFAALLKEKIQSSDPENFLRSNTYQARDLARKLVKRGEGLGIARQGEGLGKIPCGTIGTIEELSCLYFRSNKEKAQIYYLAPLNSSLASLYAAVSGLKKLINLSPYSLGHKREDPPLPTKQEAGPSGKAAHHKEGNSTKTIKSQLLWAAQSGYPDALKKALDRNPSTEWVVDAFVEAAGRNHTECMKLLQSYLRKKTFDGEDIVSDDKEQHDQYTEKLAIQYDAGDDDDAQAKAQAEAKIFFVKHYNNIDVDYDEGIFFLRAAENDDATMLALLLSKTSDTENVFSGLITSAHKGNLALTKILITYLKEKGEDLSTIKTSTAYNNHAEIQKLFDEAIES